VPRTFLRRTDPCFEQLRSRDQATEDLMKIDTLIPGALNAISSMASNPRSPGPPNPTPTPPPGGGGGGAGGGGKGKGKGKGANKRNADGSPKTDGPPSPSPSPQVPSLVPGAFASKCSWSAQVLSIVRDMPDRKTGQRKSLPTAVFDVGKFCAANGIAFNGYCWEFVCSYWLSSYDRANRVFFNMDKNRAAGALRLACARCSHSADTSNHPEALSAKHKLPDHLAKMMTYFRQG
jgi:hypothetical protein